MVLTEGNKGMTGAIEKAEELARDKRDILFLNNFQTELIQKTL